MTDVLLSRRRAVSRGAGPCQPSRAGDSGEGLVGEEAAPGVGGERLQEVEWIGERVLLEPARVEPESGQDLGVVAALVVRLDRLVDAGGVQTVEVEAGMPLAAVDPEVLPRARRLKLRELVAAIPDQAVFWPDLGDEVGTADEPLSFDPVSMLFEDDEHVGQSHRGASRNKHAELFGEDVSKIEQVDKATEEANKKRGHERVSLQDGHEDDRLPIDPFDL